MRSSVTGKCCSRMRSRHDPDGLAFGASSPNFDCRARRDSMRRSRLSSGNCASSTIRAWYLIRGLTMEATRRVGSIATAPNKNGWCQLLQYSRKRCVASLVGSTKSTCLQNAGINSSGRRNRSNPRQRTARRASSGVKKTAYVPFAWKHQVSWSASPSVTSLQLWKMSNAARAAWGFPQMSPTNGGGAPSPTASSYTNP